MAKRSKTANEAARQNSRRRAQLRDLKKIGELSKKLLQAINGILRNRENGHV